MRILKHRKSDRPKAQNRTRHQRNAERLKMRITTGDTVRVMRGDDKGKEGTVLRVYPKTGRITIEGINIAKRHRKQRTPDEQGGIIDFPAPMAVSNVMLLDAKTGQPTRVRARIDTDGTKERIGAKSGQAIPRNR